MHTKLTFSNLKLDGLEIFATLLHLLLSNMPLSNCPPSNDALHCLFLGLSSFHSSNKQNNANQNPLPHMLFPSTHGLGSYYQQVNIDFSFYEWMLVFSNIFGSHHQ
jgi:hypothetical protein